MFHINLKTRKQKFKFLRYFLQKFLKYEENKLNLFSKKKKKALYTQFYDLHLFFKIHGEASTYKIRASRS